MEEAEITFLSNADESRPSQPLATDSIRITGCSRPSGFEAESLMNLSSSPSVFRGSSITSIPAQMPIREDRIISSTKLLPRHSMPTAILEDKNEEQDESMLRIID